MLPDPPTKLEVGIVGLLGVIFYPCLFPFEARQGAEVPKEVLMVEETNGKLRVWDTGARILVATSDTP